MAFSEGEHRNQPLYLFLHVVPLFLRAKHARRGVTVNAAQPTSPHGQCLRTWKLDVVVVNGRLLSAKELNKNRLANHEAISVGRESLKVKREGEGGRGRRGYFTISLRMRVREGGWGVAEILTHTHAQTHTHTQSVLFSLRPGGLCIISSPVITR